MSKNIEMKEKLSDGSYDPLYPKTTAANTTIVDTGEYFDANNVEGALQFIGENLILKVFGTVGNFVGFGADGYIQDLQKKPSDFAPAMRYDLKTVTFASVPANGNAKASIAANAPAGYSIISAMCVDGSAPDNVICACNWNGNTLFVSAQSYWAAELTNVTATIRLTYAKI